MRHLASWGQDTDPNLENYRRGGLKLEDGMVELITNVVRFSFHLVRVLQPSSDKPESGCGVCPTWTTDRLLGREVRTSIFPTVSEPLLASKFFWTNFFFWTHFLQFSERDCESDIWHFVFNLKKK